MVLRVALLVALLVPAALPLQRLGFLAPPRGKRRGVVVRAVEVMEPPQQQQQRAQKLVVTQEAEDAFAWVEERREYRAIAADSVPKALRGSYAKSYARGGGEEEMRYYHDFELDEDAKRLEDAQTLTDVDRMSLIVELLEAVAYLHGRGLPHLSLNSKTVYVSGKSDLSLVGAGAGPKLVATKRPFAIPDDAWPFNAPETTGASAMIIRSNLRALLSMDSWSCGVLVVMLATRSTKSPFRAAPDWRLGLFDERQAVARKTTELVQQKLSAFLRDVGASSEGLVFKHGFVIQIILGLLEIDPAKRMSVAEARALAREWQGSQSAATTPRSAPSSSPPSRQRKGQQEELGRYAPNVTVSRSGEPFRSLEAMVNVIENGECPCVLEDRPEMKVPYGEIVGYRNRGDGDRWDIVVPGSGDVLPRGAVLGREYTVRRILGVVLVKGGNHKLVVEITDFPPLSRDAVLRDVYRFIDAYVGDKPQLNKDRVRFLEYDRSPHDTRR